MRVLPPESWNYGNKFPASSGQQAWPREGVWDGESLQAHVVRPAPNAYHSFDAFGEEEAVVQSAHSVIWKDLTLLLEQKVPSVQAIICPEDGKPPLFISMDEGPREQKVKL